MSFYNENESPSLESKYCSKARKWAGSLLVCPSTCTYGRSACLLPNLQPCLSPRRSALTRDTGETLTQCLCQLGPPQILAGMGSTLLSGSVIILPLCTSTCTRGRLACLIPNALALPVSQHDCFN